MKGSFPSRLIMGIDLGTSGVKCIVADEEGSIVASALEEYPLLTPHPGWAEQNPSDWWAAVVKALRSVMAQVPADRLAGVGFSGQMHGLVALDQNDEVIRPAFLWCDQRTDEQCRWITERAGGLEGLLKPDAISVVIGTAGNVSMALDHFCDNPNGGLQMFCNNEPGLWHAFGCPLTSGGAYRWYRDELFANPASGSPYPGENIYDVMNREAAQSVPGSNGVIFTPYLTGERCPYPDPNARASFYGLSLRTTRADMTRSVMEGVTYSLKQIVEIMLSFSPCEKILTSGGGSVSPLWRQMQADIFDMPVYTTSCASAGGAYGAMMVAGVGAGVWKNLEEAAGIVRIETETLPIRENQKAYQESYEIYREIYPSLKHVYDLSASKGF